MTNDRYWVGSCLYNGRRTRAASSPLWGFPASLPQRIFTLCSRYAHSFALSVGKQVFPDMTTAAPGDQGLVALHYLGPVGAYECFRRCLFA